jgi:hypothetical protein
MRLALFAIGAACLLASGCQVIPTDMFPKVKWYWSEDAKRYRAKQHRYDLVNQRDTKWMNETNNSKEP